jgi:predicted NBD/HSP70 family sugar kinase
MSALGAGPGVTRATAGAVPAELQALRLIRVDAAPGGGALGRPSHRLTIDPGGPVALAAQLHPDGFAVALVVATGHRGVGGALVLDGSLYTGSSGLGMEAGHVSVDPQGRPCPCGSYGCLNVETDALSLIEAAGRQPRPGVPMLQQATALLHEEYASDPAVRAAAGEVIERLGLGLAGLINVLNPDRILLGGLHKDLLAADPGRLRAAVAERSPWGRGSSVPVLGCALENGSLIGAAELAWQPVLDDPGLLDT